MPTYRIETNRGTFDIDADREPTPQEVEAYIGNDAAPAAPAAPKAASATADWKGGVSRVGDKLMSPEALATASARAGGQFPSGGPAPRQALGQYTKVGVPLVAAGMSGGASIPVQSAIVGGTSALSAFLGNKVAGQPTTAGEMAGAGVMGAVPGARAIPTPFMREGGRMALSPFLKTAGNVGMGAGVGGATGLTGAYIQRAIDEGEVMPFTSVKEAWQQAIIPATLGAITLGVSGRLQNNSKQLAEVARGQMAARQLGSENPSLGMVLPEYMPLEGRAASINPAIAKRRDEAWSGINRQIYEMVGNTGTNEEIATRLQPIIQKADEAEAAFKAAQQRLEKATELRQRANADLVLPPTKKAELKRQAYKEQMDAITEMAREEIKSSQVGRSLIATQTGHAQSLTGVVKRVYGARREAAGDLLEASGIVSTEPLFDKGLLLSAARKAMGSDADGDAGKAILAAIEKSKQANAAGKITGQAPAGTSPSTTLSPEESRAFIAQLQGKAPPQPVSLSLKEFQDLRDAISDDFAKVLQAQPNTLNKAEALASKAYGAMGAAIKPVIAQRYGLEGLGAYNEFLSFWARTSKLRDSAFGRSLLRGDVSDETISGLANKLAKGEVDEILNFKKFVETVGSQHPGAAAMAIDAMHAATRNSFLASAADEMGKVDYRKLGSMLQSAQSKVDRHGREAFPLDIGKLGFGSKEQINGWSKVLREFRAGDIDNAAIAEVMQSPQALHIILGDAKETGRIRQMLAAKAFEKRVRDAEIAKTVDATDAARKAWGDAMDFFRKSRIEHSEAEQIVAKVRADPLLSVFKDKSAFRFTNEAGKISGDGTIADYLGQMKRGEAKAIMGAIRKEQPQLADLIERRLFAAQFQKFKQTERGLPFETHTMDRASLRRYFNPTPDEAADHPFLWLKDVLGAEKAKKFETFATNMAQLDDRARAAAFAGAGFGPVEQMVGAARGVTTGSVSRAYSGSFITKWIHDAWNTKKYNLLSSVFLDPTGFGNAMYKANGEVGKALSSLPAQKAYLFLSDADFVRDMGKDAEEPGR